MTVGGGDCSITRLSSVRFNMPEARRGDRGRAAGASNGRPRAVAQALSRRPLLRTPATGVSSHKELLANPAGDDQTAAQIRAGKAHKDDPRRATPWLTEHCSVQ